MGAIGIGPFDDDDAADWAADLIASGSVDSVSEALLALLFEGNESLQAPECSRAIAAAEVVAALSGRGSDDLPEEIRRWADARLGAADAGLVATAAKAIEVVMTDSELQALWEESDRYAEWRERMTDLSRRLK